MPDLIMSAVIGFVAGALSGLFGIGGGIITGPALRLVMGVPELIAVGTPLPVIIPTALTGALAYWRNGLVDVRLGVTVGLLGGAVSVFGAWVSHLLGGSTVLTITAALILWTAADMIRGVLRPRAAPVRVLLDGDGRRWPWMLGLGAAAGLYSGVLGLGGGLIVTPALMRFFGLETKRAIGTSLVVVSVLAIPGMITHYALGHIDVGLALSLCVGVIPGALVGARLTMQTHEKTVRIAFAAMLLVTGVILALSEMGVL